MDLEKSVESRFSFLRDFARDGDERDALPSASWRRGSAAAKPTQPQLSVFLPEQFGHALRQPGHCFFSHERLWPLSICSP